MTIPANICCKPCAAAQTGSGAAVDYHCVACCIRLFSHLHSEDMIDGTLRSIERITGPEHAKRVRDAWETYVEGGGNHDR
jgi:hypothetical protein